MNKRIVAALSGLVVVGVLAPVMGWALMGEPETQTRMALAQAAAPATAEARPVAEAPQALAATNPSTAKAPGRLDRKPGHVVESSVSFWGRLAQGEGQDEVALLDLRGRGRMISTCYSNEDGQLVLGQRVVLDQFQAQGLREDQIAGIRKELTQGVEVLVRLSDQGKVLAMALGGVEGRQTRNFLRSWIGSQQVALAGAPSASWQAEGNDPSGTALDSYRTLASDEAGVSVERTRTFAPGQAQNPIASGQLFAILRSDGLTLQLRGDETVGIGGGETKAASIRYTRQQELDFVSERTLDADALAAARLALLDAKWDAGLALEAELSGDGPETRSTHELLQVLAADSSEGFFPLSRRLKEVPSEAALLAEAALNPAYSIAQRRSIIDVLGDVDTPESQRALLSVAKVEALPTDLLANVFLSLGQSPTPLPEVVSYFSGQIESAQGARQGWAIQGAGLLASLTQDVDTQTKLIDDLEAQLGAGKREALALSALGNAGVERSFELIGSYLHADEPTLRAEAVFALRNQPSEEASESIRQAIQDDPAPLVRQEAVRALSHRAAETHVPLAAEALKDADVSVRLEAIKTVSAWLQPEEGELEAEVQANLHAVLEAALTDDDDASVRDAAAQVLAG